MCLCLNLVVRIGKKRRKKTIWEDFGVWCDWRQFSCNDIFDFHSKISFFIIEFHPMEYYTLIHPRATLWNAVIICLSCQTLFFSEPNSMATSLAIIRKIINSDAGAWVIKLSNKLDNTNETLFGNSKSFTVSHMQVLLLSSELFDSHKFGFSGGLDLRYYLYVRYLLNIIYWHFLFGFFLWFFSMRYFSTSFNNLKNMFAEYVEMAITKHESLASQTHQRNDPSLQIFISLNSAENAFFYTPENVVSWAVI